MTPAERLRWLEETVDEMRRLQGLARGIGPGEPSGAGSSEAMTRDLRPCSEAMLLVSLFSQR